MPHAVGDMYSGISSDGMSSGLVRPELVQQQEMYMKEMKGNPISQPQTVDGNDSDPSTDAMTTRG